LKKRVKVALLLMAVLTVSYVSVVVYANANSTYDDSYDYRDPIEYGVWKHFVAEKLETPPDQWNTTEELGIVLVSCKVKEGLYHIYIDDPERALPWMNGTKPQPFAVKYADDFYRISFALWVTPGLAESIRQWQIPIGVVLGAGWVSVLFLEKGKKE
jgi:hypothetical protein